MVFTDSRAAMQRVLSDRVRVRRPLTIRLAEIIYQGGPTVDARWVPGHRGVEGNDQADQHARRAAEGGTATSLGREIISLAFLKRKRAEKAHRLWREDIARQNYGRRAFNKLQ